MADIYMNNPDLRRAIEAAGGRGGAAEDEYFKRALAYDPQASIERSAMGAMNALRPQLDRSIRDLREDQVASGRFGQGASYRAEDELTERAYANLTNQIMQNSMQGEGLRMRNMEGLGSYGSDKTGTYLEALAGLTSSRQQQDAQNKASKRSMWGNIAGAGLTAAGTILGGPIGGVVAGGLKKIFSDERVKKNIRPRTGGLGKVMAMRPVDYEYTDEGEALTGMHGRAGMVAQEMEQADPTAVGKGPGGLKTLDPWPILADLVDAVQELAAQINAREVRNA